jgi:hypothetical protein
VSVNHELPEEPIRSKGQATLRPAGYPELPATIRDISASGIGIIAATMVSPGTPVDIHIHDHAAHGAVRSCQPDSDGFYIAIMLDCEEESEAPAA